MFFPSAAKTYVGDPQRAGVANSVQNAGVVATPVLLMQGYCCSCCSFVAANSAAIVVNSAVDTADDRSATLTS